MFGRVCPKSTRIRTEKTKKLDSYCLDAVDLPIYDATESSRRPTQGYESASARNMRLYHDCWRQILGRWKEKTETARKVVFAGKICHQTRSFIGGLLGDQHVHLT